tara:strand:- start:427 stop:750 length:324 start_codon:yes stop_codon:yes gene_type:complete
MALYLKNKKKIETIFEKGFTIKADGLLFKGYDFKDDEIKYGVSVSKKLFPLAVDRNLIKRRVKEQAKRVKLAEFIAKGISFFLIYTSKQILNSNEIKRRIEVLSQKL